MPHLQNGNMHGRHKIPDRKSKKNFTRHAMHPDRKNGSHAVMRGGIRF